MKILFSLCCLLLLLAGKPALAQEKVPLLSDRSAGSNKLEALYLSLGAGGTLIPEAGFPIAIRLTGLLPNGRGLAIGIRGSNMANQNAPSGPHQAVVKGFAIFGIKDGFSVVDLCAVRKFWLQGTRRQLRLGVEAGAAMVTTRIHSYSLLLQYYNDPIPTYLAEPVSRSTPGLQLALNAACVPTRAFGLEVCLWGNLNVTQPLMGLEVCLLLGKVRSKGF